LTNPLSLRSDWRRLDAPARNRRFTGEKMSVHMSFSGPGKPVLAAFLLLAGAIGMAPAQAQAPQPDTSLTGAAARLMPQFSGVRPGPGTGNTADPAERFVIDTQAPVVWSVPGGGVEPRPLRATAAQVGQVFGLARDNAAVPNLYLAATSLFGLPVIGADGTRLRAGQAGARFMPGLWGPGGGPGSIWRYDTATGAVRLFATVPGNGGAGLGGLAVDPLRGDLYVADRQSGLIHRIGVDGALRDVFDHGRQGRQALGLPPVDGGSERTSLITDPAFRPGEPQSWGLAPAARRPFALMVHQSRLYYGIAEGLQVYSVALTPEGGFGTDVRREVALPARPANAAAAMAEIVGLEIEPGGTLLVREHPGASGSFEFSPLAAPGPQRAFRFARAGNGWGPPVERPQALVEMRAPLACAPSGACDVAVDLVQASTLALPQAPTLGIEISGAPASFQGITTPGWTCTPRSTTRVECVPPTGAFEPGRTLALVMRLKMGDGANGPLSICASVPRESGRCKRVPVEAGAPAQGVPYAPRVTAVAAPAPAPAAAPATAPPVPPVAAPPVAAPPVVAPPVAAPPVAAAPPVQPPPPVSPPPVAVAPPVVVPPVAAPPAVEPAPPVVATPEPAPQPRPRACPSGTVLRGERCVSRCDEGQTWNGERCVARPRACREGQTFIDGRCRDIRRDRDREFSRACPPNFVYDDTVDACVRVQRLACPPGFVRTSEGCIRAARACPPGFIATSRGCIRDEPVCSPGFVYDARRDLCIRMMGQCPPGTVWTGQFCARTW
jgi:hypothetical protein